MAVQFIVSESVFDPESSLAPMDPLPDQGEKITVDQSKVLKNRLFRFLEPLGIDQSDVKNTIPKYVYFNIKYTLKTPGSAWPEKGSIGAKYPEISQIYK